MGYRLVKSSVEISGARLRQNFRAVQRVVGPEVEVLAVVKADGYGHGAALCAPVLRDAGANWLGVTDVQEGTVVRAALGENATRILVMCGMEAADAGAVVEHGLTPVVWTVEQIAALGAAAQPSGTRVRVHVEVDTGMSRQGVPPGDPLLQLAKVIAAAGNVLCEGVMTHLCCAEVAGAGLTEDALKRFDGVFRTMQEANVQLPDFKHVANTSAVDEGTVAAQRDAITRERARRMVRTGIALYGYCLEMEGAVHEAALRPFVQPVMTWKTRVIGVREIETGATVGYGATFVAPRKMRLALLPVGYADGFRREASSGLGNGWVMLTGKPARVVGRVSMNLTVVDVSDIPGVEVGCEAVLLGEGVTAEDHARWADTIPYDILCGVPRVRRLV